MNTRIPKPPRIPEDCIYMGLGPLNGNVPLLARRGLFRNSGLSTLWSDFSEGSAGFHYAMKRGSDAWEHFSKYYPDLQDAPSTPVDYEL